MMLSSRLQRLMELESQVKYRSLPEPGMKEYRFFPGSRPLLVSAPHGAAHTRLGRLKQEDEFTTGLALLLQELTGAHVLCCLHRSPTDPNFYPGVPYKQTLAEIKQTHPFQALIDLHGSSPQHGFGIAVGTMCGRSLPGRRKSLIKTLAAYGYDPQAAGLQRVDLDQRFTAAGGTRQETVTRYVWENLSIPAVQIEINARLRIVKHLNGEDHDNGLYTDPRWVEHTIDLLVAVVNTLMPAVSSWPDKPDAPPASPAPL